VRIGSRDQWLAKARSHFCGPAIRVQKAFVKMAELDRVEAIDFVKKARSD
jgi:hypothetical protein